MLTNNQSSERLERPDPSSVDAADLHADGSPGNHVRHSEAELFGRYAAIIRRLRAQDGCPWDKKQTLRSLRRYIVEEAFEVLAAINDFHDVQRSAPSPVPAPETSSDPSAVLDELGDVFLVSLLLADALERETGVTLESVLLENGRKLIRRHPHVFGSIDATTPEEVVTNWNQIKRDQEGRTGSVAHVSRGLPPLERAFEMQKKAAQEGFDWDTFEPVLAKLKEEIGELEARMADIADQGLTAKDDSAIEEELGDILFSVVNVSRHLKTDPSVALARTNEKFLTRFQYIEQETAARDLSLSDLPLETLDRFWNSAKDLERLRAQDNQDNDT